MGLTALATVFVYHSAFDVMAALMTDIERTEQGYTFFNLANHAICQHMHHATRRLLRGYDITAHDQCLA